MMTMSLNSCHAVRPAKMKMAKSGIERCCAEELPDGDVVDEQHGERLGETPEEAQHAVLVAGLDLATDQLVEQLTAGPDVADRLEGPAEEPVARSRGAHRLDRELLQSHFMLVGHCSPGFGE